MHNYVVDPVHPSHLMQKYVVDDPVHPAQSMHDYVVDSEHHSLSTHQSVVDMNCLYFLVLIVSKGIVYENVFQFLFGRSPKKMTSSGDPNLCPKVHVVVIPTCVTFVVFKGCVDLENMSITVPKLLR